jgi:predicted RNA binding protein YcfA (HicA-like mRNA interferase family)
MDIEKKLYIGVIKVLNQNGFQVLRINGEFYSVEEFTPSDRNVPYHHLKGKHITQLIISNLNVGINVAAVIQNIEGSKTSEIRFSSGFEYEWYIDVK